MKPVQQEYISILTLPTDTFCVCWKWFFQLFSLARTPFAVNYLLHTMQAQVQTPGFVLRRSEMLLGWYRVKGINSDIVGAAPGPCDHGWSAEPRNSRPHQKWSWDVDVRKYAWKIRIFGKTFFWDAALLMKMSEGVGTGGLGRKNTRISKFFRSAQKSNDPRWVE